MSTSESIEEELTIMDERRAENGAESSMESGVSIEDPIRTLDLKAVISVQSGAKLTEVISLLQEKNIGCVTVLDSSEKTIGIFTERDILKKIINKNVDLNRSSVDEFMTPNPQILSEEDPIAFALNKMSIGSYRHIPISRNNEVKFMLSIKDIVDQIAGSYRKKVINLPPDPKQQITEYGG